MAASPVLPKLVGQRVKRREDPRLIQGRGTYVDDIKIVGLQHLAFKRSDIAHGRILSIDTTAAEALDGVEAVFTGAQLAEFLDPMPVGTPFPSPEHRAVATDVVCFVGDSGRRRRGPRPLRGARRGRRHHRRLRAAAGRGRPRAGNDRAAGGAARRLSEQPGGWAAACRYRRRTQGSGRRQRHRPGVLRSRRRSVTAHGQPAAGAGVDRAARRRRALRARQGGA